jgi:predicted amidohydrolase YtcJ
MSPTGPVVPREAAPEAAADLILYGGSVLSMDARNRRAEAVAVRAGRVLLLGADRDVLRLCGENTLAVDLAGRAALPGFIETHSHPIYFGLQRRFGVDAGTPPNETIADILDRIAAKVGETPPGTWIRGERYDDTLLREMRHPTRHDLDRVAPAHPVYLSHISGHLGTANSLALQIAGITRETADPAGGRILRDAAGEPTGVLAEAPAQRLVLRHLPRYAVEDLREGLEAANEEYVAAGITSAHDTGAGIIAGGQEIGVYRAAIRAGRFRPRLYAFLTEAVFPELAEGRLHPLESAVAGMGDDRFRLGAVKLWADGSIQGLTGALAEPYACAPETTGVLIHPEQADLDRRVRALHDGGWQIGIHGNGDAGIEAILDAYAAALAAAPRPDHRHRIEHCQMAREDQLDRMAELGVCASFFVKHVYYWGDRHRDIFIGPERAARISPLRSAEERGIRFALHSDCPVTPVAPLEGVWAAANRLTRDGAILGPDQRVSVETALRGYTANAAYLAFEEDAKGTLEPGKLGDIVVLSADPTHVPPETIDRIAVELTIVGGEVVYEKVPAAAHDRV